MTTTKSLTAPARSMLTSRCRARASSLLSHLFLGLQLARLILEHDRDVVFDWISEPARAADQLLLGLLVQQGALAQRAHEDVKQLGVHGGISVWRGSFG